MWSAGFKLAAEQRKLFWKIDNGIDELDNLETKRQFFPFCGQVLGHLPVFGWMRVASSFVKKLVSESTDSWDKALSDKTLKVFKLFREKVF